MSEVLQTNIFFIITAIAVLIITVLIGIALYHVIKILRKVDAITDRLKQGTETLADDVSSLRSQIVDGPVGMIVRKFTGGAKKPRRAKKKEESADEE